MVWYIIERRFFLVDDLMFPRDKHFMGIRAYECSLRSSGIDSLDGDSLVYQSFSKNAQISDRQNEKIQHQ